MRTQGFFQTQGSSQSQHNEQSLLTQYAFPIALVGIFIFLFLAPLLIMGALLALLFQSAYFDKDENQPGHLIWALIITFILYVFFLGIFPSSSIGVKGAFFTGLKPAMLKIFEFIANSKIGILHSLLRGVDADLVRTSLWMSYPVGLGIFAVLYFKQLKPALSIFALVQSAFFPLWFLTSNLLASVITLLLGAVFCSAAGAPPWLNDLLFLIWILSLVVRLGDPILNSALDGLLGRDEVKTGPIQVGRVRDSIWKRATITESELNHHVHVVGASGYGKSVLLSHIIENRIHSGTGLLFVDLKADFETIRFIVSQAKEAGRIEDLMIFSCGSPELSTNYNPLSTGTATQVRDRILMSLTWSEEYYKSISATVLLKILIGLCWLRDRKAQPFGLQEVCRFIEDAAFAETCIKSIPEKTQERSALSEVALKLKDKEVQKGLSGLRSQLESLLYSDFGHLLSSENSGIELFEAMKHKKIIYILLDSRSYGESSKTLGKLVIQDLKAASARIDREVAESDRKPFTVVIDEFADMATEDFIGYLDRARSSKTGVVVAHQEIADLDSVSPEFKKRLMNATSTTFAFLQKIPESSEMIAGISGTKKTDEVTQQARSVPLFGDMLTGAKSIKEVDEFIIHPNVIRSLKVGECVAVRKYPKSGSDVLIIRPGRTDLLPKSEVIQLLTKERPVQSRRSYFQSAIAALETKAPPEPEVDRF